VGYNIIAFLDGGNLKSVSPGWAVVAHIYNSSYLGSGD
jgi:hypothetical protein